MTDPFLPILQSQLLKEVQSRGGEQQCLFVQTRCRDRGDMGHSHAFCSWQQPEKCEFGQFSLVSAFREIWLFQIHYCPILRRILVAPFQESIICFAVCSALITLLPREGRKQQTNFFHSFSIVFSPRVSFGIQGAICFVT